MQRDSKYGSFGERKSSDRNDGDLARPLLTNSPKGPMDQSMDTPMKKDLYFQRLSEDAKQGCIAGVYSCYNLGKWQPAIMKSTGDYASLSCATDIPYYVSILPQQGVFSASYNTFGSNPCQDKVCGSLLFCCALLCLPIKETARVSGAVCDVCCGLCGNFDEPEATPVGIKLWKVREDLADIPSLRLPEYLKIYLTASEDERDALTYEFHDELCHHITSSELKEHSLEDKQQALSYIAERGKSILNRHHCLEHKYFYYGRNYTYKVPVNVDDMPGNYVINVIRSKSSDSPQLLEFILEKGRAREFLTLAIRNKIAAAFDQAYPLDEVSEQKAQHPQDTAAKTCILAKREILHRFHIDGKYHALPMLLFSIAGHPRPVAQITHEYLYGLTPK